MTARRSRRLKLSPVMSPGDWIGYRHSVAEVWRRVDRGEARGEIRICPECATEVDVRVPIHSPRCSLGSAA